MTLEDHAGDVVRKARLMAGVSLETAARTAGLSPAHLREWERSGNGPGRPAFAALGALLQLAPGRLERLAAGWLPRVPDLDRWQHLQQVTTEGAGMHVHCYLAWDASAQAAALLDTGFDLAPAWDVLRQQDVHLEHLFITHGHGDHMGGLDQVRQAWPQVAVHQGGRAAAATISLGRLRIQSRATPGHTADGMTYVVTGWPDQASPVAIVGDALFAGSMGGAEAAGALARKMVWDEILSLPAATLICPGHGPLTTVGEELECNPFFPIPASSASRPAPCPDTRR